MPLHTVGEVPVEIIFLLVILVGSTLLYVTRWLAIEVTATLTIVALVLTGILTPGQAFSGFSSSATLTVAAMFVLSGGLLRTGALEMVTLYLARFSRGEPVQLLLLLALTVPLASAFVNNTPVVVMMVPVILALGRQFGHSPSRFLLPVSYFAILGGTLTLLGTSTNILVDGIYREAGGPGFALFDFAPLGLIYAGVGTLYILAVSQRILPDHPPLLNPGVQQSSAVYVTEVVVPNGSVVVGRRAGDVVDRVATAAARARANLLHRQRRRVGRLNRMETDQGTTDRSDRVELLELFRGEAIYRGSAAADLQIQVDDALIIAGPPNAIARFLAASQTHLATVLADDRRVPMGAFQQTVVEAVVLPQSPFIGRQLGRLSLHGRYGVTVMGLQRRGRQRRQGLRTISLQSGDVLLLQGEMDRLRALREEGGLLLVEGVEQTILRSAKNRQALLIMLGVVLLATLTETPIAVLALAGAAALILTRCLRPDEALRALDAPTLFLLAGTIPLGLALESTGLAARVVEGVLALSGGADPRLFLSLFYLLTSVLTELISNNAVAVLLTPIALKLAATLGVDPKPLLMAIAFGASASFMTPMGYQTNAIVMGPGGYTFKDYLKFGVPLNLLMWVVATICIPLFWPL